MDYETWSPVYRDLLVDFGFEMAADERARDVLVDLLAAREQVDQQSFDPGTIGAAGETVAIAGAGPSLSNPTELDRARDADLVFAASSAADVLLDADVPVDCVVTDLDGTPETARDCSHDGIPVAVHAHGDNVPALEAWVPEFDLDFVVPTTQARPVAPVQNFGGFTDGDRAAFLADHLGAGRLVFVGWDLDDPDVDAMKARKLDWAARLLRWLEVRRGERFDVLDGRRDGLDVSGFPV